MDRKERISLLTVASNRFFGRAASHIMFFKQVYNQSGLRRSYESYVALMLTVCSIGFISAFATSILIPTLVLGMPLPQLLLVSIVLSCVISIAVASTFIIFPLYRSGRRKKEIDANLVYTAGYMQVLSAGGIPVERIFERVAEVERSNSIRDLEIRIIANIKMFGLDASSALQDVTAHCPSEIFSKLLAGITNSLRTSPSLKNLLTFESQRLLHEKKEQMKKTLNSLTAFGELYITGVVIGPIVFIVLITILSVMGNVAFGLSPIMQLNLLVFFGIPALGAVCIVVLNSILPEEE